MDAGLAAPPEELYRFLDQWHIVDYLHAMPDGVINFSYRPLQISSALGLTVCLL
ncbi:hypothetical protein H6F44_21555 [Pseudanabaena sp. FACHB-1277]|jgi:hypothetical protein|uniref:Uncharacterized protein n=1 Tax=Pseudanabaena cinerea FACHB-1277 TaxID=2949581 RepID=A0A926UWZ9_9CYAN|nr:hypothetical protein [Pseudanabaena cinerea]MBD2152685.1 hypothetical protein [Pseudanabaena cinerea FACHB-1277]